MKVKEKILIALMVHHWVMLRAIIAIAKKGRNSRPSSSSSNKGGSKKEEKIGKDTARRNDVTEALRRRGWRQSDTEEEKCTPR